MFQEKDYLCGTKPTRYILYARYKEKNQGARLHSSADSRQAEHQPAGSVASNQREPFAITS